MKGDIVRVLQGGFCGCSATVVGADRARNLKLRVDSVDPVARDAALWFHEVEVERLEPDGVCWAAGEAARSEGVSSER